MLKYGARSTFWVALILACAPHAVPQEIPQSADFRPLRKSGVLQGCTIVFVASHPSHLSTNVDVLLLSGSFGVVGTDRGLSWFLKLGLSDEPVGDDIERPHFAYLLSKTTSTAKDTAVIADGDPGYRMFGGAFGDTARKVTLEMLEAARVEIGFNRAVDELDVIVALNLRASEQDTPMRFLKCLEELLTTKGAK